MTVLTWLSCLQPSSDIIGIVCEHVEDIVIVYTNRVSLVQLKTKNRGSWSDISVCGSGGGLDSLTRSYKEMVLTSTAFDLELWLEGPAGLTKNTDTFFRKPSSASSAVRSKLKRFSLTPRQQSDFLGRLSIRTDRPPRAHVDSVVLRSMGAIWPALGQGDLEYLYAELLAFAEKAQAGDLDCNSSMTGVIKAFAIEPKSEMAAAFSSKVLTRELLQAITPPLPQSTRADITHRLAQGASPSALELKLIAAGAGEETVEFAQTSRAAAEIRKYELLGVHTDAVARFTKLDKPLLAFANAFVAEATLLGGSNPSIAAKPAEHVSTRLRTNPSDLLAIDSQDLFDRQTDLLYGYLCQLSDECKFWWRAVS